MTYQLKVTLEIVQSGEEVTDADNPMFEVHQTYGAYSHLSNAEHDLKILDTVLLNIQNLKK